MAELGLRIFHHSFRGVPVVGLPKLGDQSNWQASQIGLTLGFLSASSNCPMRWPKTACEAGTINASLMLAEEGPAGLLLLLSPLLPCCRERSDLAECWTVPSHHQPAT